MKLKKFLHKTYYDPENNASFSSVNKLYKITKDKFPTVTLSNILKNGYQHKMCTHCTNQ